MTRLATRLVIRLEVRPHLVVRSHRAVLVVDNLVCLSGLWFHLVVC